MNDLGTVDNPIRILIADNWGAAAKSFLTSSFPNIKFSVYKHARSTHPHGHQVAECVCHMLPHDVHAEIVFLPYLTLQRDPRYNWKNVIQAEREAGRPFHLANCSFGQHHGNRDALEQMLGDKWDNPEKLAEVNEKVGDTIVVFAAGNHDQSTRRRTHKPNDINYPQRALAQLKNVYLIGSCDPDGIPSLFSSDGREVFAMYLGEGVVLYDSINNHLSKVNGTSFAAPFATGDLAEQMCRGNTITEEWYLSYVEKHAFLAEGWKRYNPDGSLTHHRKAGYGCMLSVMYDKDYFQLHYSNAVPATNIDIEYHDFDQI